MGALSTEGRRGHYWYLNAPLFTLFSPLASVLAAGNRAVLKPSEVTPCTAEMVARAVANYFAPDELAVVTGDSDVAATFSAEPWDHLVFTGSTGIGKLIMRAAAENLVPVTLELGGKSPVLVSYETIDAAVTAINAGERPLALYYFGEDVAEQNWVLDHTLSGGVSINDVAMQPALHDAPFGGVGASGMGHYHGREGFLTFSHARSVYCAGPQDPRREWGMLPPYNEQFVAMIRAAVTS